MSAAARAPASPHSTGGGGFVLEHKYGATLIAALLTGDSLPELGDNATPFSVRFQASAESPVDDLLVAGHTSDGRKRRVSIGVRRAPQFVRSDKESVPLLAAYVRVVTSHWDEVRAGRWRLALATASREKATTQVRDLAGIARGNPSEQGFRDQVARSNQDLRKRLIHVDELVRKAARQAGAGAAGIDADELTWRLLSSLTMRELRLEAADTADRTAVVNRLRDATRDRTAGAADALFARLAELSGRYAPAGALITKEMLRRDLSGVPLADSPAPPATQPVAALLLTGTGAAPRGEAPLEARWRAGQEGWLGDRRYLLLRDQDGLLRAERDPGGERIRRQALARQTDPAPAAGRAYVWLRQAGRDLTRERDLLARVLAAPDARAAVGPRGRQGGRPAAGLPGIADFEAAAGAVTLALSWPAERDGPPCRTMRAWFTPGALDGWRLSLLLAGLRSLMFPLERLHRLGVSHRNLAPEAVIVIGKGEFALRDLGLAATGYRPGEGPASYQAPEQALGARMTRPGPATDVYQLAAIAYHLITGRVPGRSAPPARHPALPDSVTGAISDALAPGAADRPGLPEFRAALRPPPKSRPESNPR
jgi:hypothetical protein